MIFILFKNITLLSLILFAITGINFGRTSSPPQHKISYNTKEYFICQAELIQQT